MWRFEGSPLSRKAGYATISSQPGKMSVQGLELRENMLAWVHFWNPCNDKIYRGQMLETLGNCTSDAAIVSKMREDEWLVIASDGLWNVLTNQEVCDSACRKIMHWHIENDGVADVSSATASSGENADPAAQTNAEHLLNLALKKGSSGNITIIVVDLKAHRKFKIKA